MRKMAWAMTSSAYLGEIYCLSSDCSLCQLLKISQLFLHGQLALFHIGEQMFVLFGHDAQIAELVVRLVVSTSAHLAHRYLTIATEDEMMRSWFVRKSNEMRGLTNFFRIPLPLPGYSDARGGS